MQVDHIIALKRGGADSLENVNPSCRKCNKYKSSLALEDFRNWLLGGLTGRLRKLFAFKMAEKYNMVSVHEWDKKFYFEKVKK